MAIIQRPGKEGNATTYQGKVAAGYTKILAQEVDADIDAIYAAWNGGVDTVNIRAGAVGPAQLAQGAVTPNALAQGAVTAPAIAAGAVTAPALGPNAVTNPAIAPGAVNSASIQDGSIVLGDLAPAVQGPINGTFGASITLNPRVWFSANGNTLDLLANDQSGPAYDPNRSRWLLRLDYTADGLVVYRGAPAGGGYAQLLASDNAGNVTATGFYASANINANGQITCNGILQTNSDIVGGQIRCRGFRCSQGGGSLVAGYSNQIGFGFDSTGHVTCAVDNNYQGTVNITPPSDERLKADVLEDVPGLAAVLALRPVTFDYTAEHLPTGRHYGLIAQEAQAHVPLAVHDDGSEEHYLGLDYRVLVPVLINAIKELAARVDKST